MALITRISRLFRADLHAVLDRIEEPDLLLRQALREMEGSFAGDEQQLKLMKHEAVQIHNRIEESQRAIEEMDEELDICFFSQQEDLARTLVRKKLQTRHRLKLAEERLASTRQNCSAMELKLDEQRTQLESLRQKIELLQEEPDIHSTDIQVQLHEAPIGDAEVEIAFLKEKQKRSQS